MCPDGYEARLKRRFKVGELLRDTVARIHLNHRHRFHRTQVRHQIDDLADHGHKELVHRLLVRDGVLLGKVDVADKVGIRQV